MKLAEYEAIRALYEWKCSDLAEAEKRIKTLEEELALLREKGNAAA